MKLSFSWLFLHFICFFFSIKENHHIWLPITLVHWKEKPSTLRWNDKQQRRTSYLNEWSNLSIFFFFLVSRQKSGISETSLDSEFETCYIKMTACACVITYGWWCHNYSRIDITRSGSRLISRFRPHTTDQYHCWARPDKSNLSLPDIDISFKNKVVLFLELINIKDRNTCLSLLNWTIMQYK